MERHSELVAAVLSALFLVLITAAVVFDPDFADRLTREDQAVESLQAALFAVAGGFALRAAWERWRAGASPVFEILVASMLAGLVIGELDLDRLLVGRKIISTRFLVDAHVWLGWRVIALLVMALPPAALALYALLRRRDLIAAIRCLRVHSPGRVFVVGVLIFGLTEILEKPLGRIPGPPRYMLEEALELVAGIWMSVGVYGYSRLRRAERVARKGP